MDGWIGIDVLPIPSSALLFYRQLPFYNRPRCPRDLLPLLVGPPGRTTAIISGIDFSTCLRETVTRGQRLLEWRILPARFPEGNSQFLSRSATVSIVIAIERQQSPTRGEYFWRMLTYKK